MTFGHYGGGSGIPRLYTHKEALAQLENTKPIKGRAEAEYPLGRRGAVDSYSIRKTDNGDIECVLYGYTVVTYHQDSTVTVHCAQTSQMSMANFVWTLLGLVSYQHDYKLEVRVQSGNYALARGESLKLSHDPVTYQFAVLDTPTKYIHRIKRKETSLVRVKYNDMRDYVSGMVKVRDGAFSQEDLSLAFGTREHSYERQNGTVAHWSSPAVPDLARNKPEEVEELFGWYECGEPEQMNKCALWLMESSSYQYYRNSMKKIALTDVLEMLDMFVLARHKHEVFKKVEVPKGQVKKDRYSWAW
jgi:hypothetical protein